MMKIKNCLVNSGYRGLLLALLILLHFTPAHAQDAKVEYERPRNVQIVKEYTDEKGRDVRVLKYYQGNMVITEEIFTSGKKNYAAMAMRPINPDTLNKDSLTIVVNKSNYTVQLMYKRRTIRRYKAVFGPKPLMNKCMEGDRCTPEGWFTIKHKNPNSKYDRFMLIDYPNDVTRERFSKLKAEGKIPASALIGGDIGIHGIWQGGDDMIEMGVGWTDGCVALKNKDIEELFSFVGVGTRVLIKK